MDEVNDTVEFLRERVIEARHLVEELLKQGRHDGPCVYDDDGCCELHLEAFEARREAAEAAVRRWNAHGPAL